MGPVRARGTEGQENIIAILLKTNMGPERRVLPAVEPVLCHAGTTALAQELRRLVRAFSAREFVLVPGEGDSGRVMGYAADRDRRRHWLLQDS